MNEGEIGTLAGDLVRIHRAINRGFSVATDASYNFARMGFSDEDVKQGFLSYLRAHVAVLAAHHRTEDEVFFPRLRQCLTGVPYQELLTEHSDMEPFFDQIRLALADLRVGHHVKESLEVLAYALNKNRELWRPHIYKEEQYFCAGALNAVLTTDQQAQLQQAMAAHSLQNARPEALVLPFILYNLAAADRVAFSANLPPHLLARVQGEWKGVWRTMQPFLLA